jgi:hypothetical protein
MSLEAKNVSLRHSSDIPPTPRPINPRFLNIEALLAMWKIDICRTAFLFSLAKLHQKEKLKK